MALTGFSTETGAGQFISDVTPTTLYTANGGAGKIARLGKLLITNTNTTTTYWVTIYKVPSGGSISGDDYVIWRRLNIGPSNKTTGTEDIREVAGMLLDNGDSLRALAEASGVLKFHLDGLQES